MVYLLLFLEGILTFISPCILPLMPIYLAYFMGEGKNGPHQNRQIVISAIYFVLGFSIVFILMGLFIAQIGTWFVAYQRQINWITGLIVMIFGFDMLGSMSLLSRIRPLQLIAERPSSSFILGLTFAVSWTPCVGTFLASVYSLILNSQSYGQATIMLIIYCLGLGIPFILTAVLLDQMKSVFDWLKQHQRHIQIFSGTLLIILGGLMMSGHITRWLVLLS